MKKRVIRLLLALAMVVGILPSTAFAASLMGDADGSGEVDYVDAMIVLQYHTGVVGDNALDLAVCDVDGSGEVDYVDAMMILQYHTGVLPELHEHEWVDATCETAKTCKSCGATEGAATGHNWKDATCTTPKTCTKCNTTEGSAAGHSWKDATCTTPKTCSKCGATEGSAAGHSWQNATCTTPKTCSKCGATEGSAAGHNWKEATCGNPKTCSNCGATEGSAATNHNYVETSKTDGYNVGSIISYRCTECGHTKDQTIEALSLSAYRSGFVSISGWISQVSYTVNATGGYGKVQYKFEVFVNESTASAALTEDFSENNSFGWTSRNYCNGHVLIVTAQDEAGNKAALKIVVDVNDKITQIEAKDPAVSTDTTPPVIHSISIDKREVTIGDEVNITMSVTDESKITSCHVSFYMSNGAEGNADCYLKLGEDGLYHGTIKIDSTFVAGRCTLKLISVVDALSNQTFVYPASETYPDIYFDVVGASTDTTPPVIHSISIDKKEVAVGDEVNITMSVTDESKIAWCHVSFYMSNGAEGNADCYLKLGEDGLYHGTIKIDSTFVAGRCTLKLISVVDALSNQAFVYPASKTYPDIYFDVIPAG